MACSRKADDISHRQLFWRIVIPGVVAAIVAVPSIIFALGGLYKVVQLNTQATLTLAENDKEITQSMNDMNSNIHGLKEVVAGMQATQTALAERASEGRENQREMQRKIESIWREVKD